MSLRELATELAGRRATVVQVVGVVAKPQDPTAASTATILRNGLMTRPPAQFAGAEFPPVQVASEAGAPAGTNRVVVTSVPTGGTPT